VPDSLSHIPLENFAKALTWLSQQPQVDPRHIYTAGFSRGSEAVLLLGVYYPSLVHGVIATSPSNVALCSYPAAGHGVGTLVPYEPESPSLQNGALEGLTPLANDDARAQVWPRLLAFLARSGH
jgi:dienelactone hydrolase